MTILTTTLLMLLWLGAGQASAWTVTVRNPTKHGMRVFVYIHQILYVTSMTAANLEGGGSYTFDTGGWCPVGLGGSFLYRKPLPDLQGTNCWGNAFSSSVDPRSQLWWTPCCWNLNFSICKKNSTTDEWNIKDDYGFCKD
jgi:hypothetical protein